MGLVRVGRMSNNFFEQIKLFLPKYLTPAQQTDLYKELKRHPNNDNYYLSSGFENDYLQGDSWKGFLAINFNTLEKKQVSGVIISNSCDIDPENNPVNRNILFSPIIKLSNYIKLLEQANKKNIDDIITSIKKQRTTNIFYLPAYGNKIEESIILLDNLHSHPLSHFIEHDKEKIVTLSQYAFYLFLIKLSIHFSRFQEGISRFDLEAA